MSNSQTASAHTPSKADVAAAKSDKRPVQAGTGKISTLALTMMTVTTLAGIANDVQMSFYGLSAVTYFLIGGILFFVPTGLVAAELASGWSQRGGIFRWVGEGLGTFPAISCLLILWFQTSFSFGSGIPGSAATIGFFTTNYDWAVNFAEQSHPWTVTLPIMLGWLCYYWFICWLATKGVKVFANIAKYGVIFGTFLPLAVMMILAVVWLCQGHHPAIPMEMSGFVPKWNGMATLSLAAGVFFSFAGVDMNAAHIKDLKKPGKQFPIVVFVSMILAFLIFVIGTVIIAMIVPESQINLLYTLNTVYRDLGATIGFPDLYLVFVYLGMANSFAALITNLAGPSYMLGQAGRSGFLPKFLQNNNKHGMPSRMMYFQMLFMTLIAFVVFFLPNVEGFVALITQAITILYMMYYILMFTAFIKLRYDQPNRPRAFKVPGGMVGAWIVTIVGIAASVFAIVLALYPPAQLAKEVGSGAAYDIIIICLIAFVVFVCFLMYRASRKHKEWVDPSNQFAPFTWQIEGLKKPGRVESNIPTALLSTGQDPMGMPIKHHYDPNEKIDLPDPKDQAAYAAAVEKLLEKEGVREPDAETSAAVFTGNMNQMKTVAIAPKPVHHVVMEPHGDEVDVPQAPADMIAAAKLPDDPAADEAKAKAAAQDASVKAHEYEVIAQAEENRAEEDALLEAARQKAREAEASATYAEQLLQQSAAHAAASDAKSAAPAASSAPVQPATPTTAKPASKPAAKPTASPTDSDSTTK
ncbi:APC family permease [Bifidobacterium gallicum]|uniref:Amino acid permease n=1 Tax=Bifidobacterium gallicum DSM 20093 = LMG 11596 TaxID=561180 RepID=D1NTD1_9BIFI|nr:APC family permease [Bifidobacterium gallicum]EFA22985.1 amino acid permease [Bifidobacterium gallicum DSM 20093 = LMG 11596]KFI57697.1 amino acid transporter [Bifidobacterium gallicum DSM 20093 = LMG 11596]